MKKLIVIIIFITSLPVISQTLEGVVIDNYTKSKLPYANLSLKNRDYGTSTDSKGYFTLNFKKINKTDSLIITYIGYKNKIVSLKNIISKNTKNLVFKLDKEQEVLDEVIISSKKINYRNSATNLGIKKRKGTFRSSVPFGYESAVFIKNVKNKLGKITEITLKLKYKNI